MPPAPQASPLSASWATARVADIVAGLIGMYDIDHQTGTEAVLAFLHALDEMHLLASGRHE
jgi:hypothetical protein